MGKILLQEKSYLIAEVGVLRVNKIKFCRSIYEF